MMEQHLIIDWTNHFSELQIRLTKLLGSLVVEKVISMEAFSTLGRLMRMRDFYHVNVDDFRGANNFTIYLITDPNPVYDYRGTTKGHRLVNTTMFDLKQTLRAQAGGGCSIHTTDNIQETQENLRALGLYHLYDRTEFKSLKKVFDALNKGGINYVVLRNYQGYPTLPAEEHPDVDILTDDYYAVKRIIDGDNPFRPSYEDGGYRVHNYVKVGGDDVGFDIRHIGDNYYDTDFENRILRNRIRHKNFWIPCDHDHYFALLYHDLVHKGRKRDIGWEPLDEWVYKNAYQYVKPNDTSVGYHRE